MAAARVIGALAVLALSAGTARATVELQTVGWQMTAAQGPRATAKSAKDIDRLALKANAARLPGRLLGTVKLLNRGTPVEGILLRYSVTGKIAPADGSREPLWALPFMLETRRVPKAGANSVLSVPLEATPLTELYLRKLRREGYVLRELKMQVMLEPRKGADAAVKIVEAAIPVEEAPK